MKKVELLAPAGNMESLYQAIHHGADAVYLGGMKFGARKFASNFNNEELVQAIHLCHLYGVKIYITINTLIFDHEIEELVDYVTFLHKSGVDAVIVQDLGVISLLRQKFPNLIIHASTQMHNHNDRGLSLLQKMGVTRAVLARELSLDEIVTLQTPIEKEVFVHGALCICYSGCCLMSSMIGGRSGNRGECAGSCRLPYTLYQEKEKCLGKGDYLLSPKDLNTLNEVPKLIEAGITAFKIEGRMKSPTYVGIVTKFYRKAIDAYYEGSPIIFTADEMKELKRNFYRGFTKGYLFYDHDIINPTKPNHMGILVGEVTDIKKHIKIKLCDNLHQGDGIQFVDGSGMMVNMLYNEKGNLIKEASAKDIVLVDNKCHLQQLGKVVKTLDYLQNKEFEEVTPKKVKVIFSVFAKVGKKLWIKIQDEIHQIEWEGSVVTQAKTCPLTKEKIVQQLKKTGNTPFFVERVLFDAEEKIFIPIQEINELRRILCDQLQQLREKSLSYSYKKSSYQLDVSNVYDDQLSLSVLIRSESQLQAVLDSPVSMIYVTDLDLCHRYQDERIFYVTPRIGREEHDLPTRLLIGEIGAFQFPATSVVTDYFIHATNCYTVRFLEYMGAQKVTISKEISMEQLKELYDTYQNIFHSKPSIEVIVFGRTELMISKHCFIKDQKKCSECKRHNYYLKDRFGYDYPIKQDATCHNHIYHHASTSYLKDIPDLLNIGIRHYRLDFLEETKEEAKQIVDQYLNALKIY